jgi:hypothetical protein
MSYNLLDHRNSSLSMSYYQKCNIILMPEIDVQDLASIFELYPKGLF